MGNSKLWPVPARLMRWIIPVCLVFAAFASRAQPIAPAAAGRWLSELGCVQCHTDLPGGSGLREQAPDLGHAGLRYRTSYLLEFLQRPERVRRHIGRARMPNFHLNEKEALALALFLEQQRKAPANWPQLPNELRQATDSPSANVSRQDFDRTLASGLTCLTCHTMNGSGGPTGPELVSVGHQLHPAWIKSYLVAPPMFGVPTNVMPAQFYRLSHDEREFEALIPQAARAITTISDYLTGIGAQRRAALDENLTAARKAHPQSTAALGEQLFRAFNCAACHRNTDIKPREQAAPTLAGQGLRVQKNWLEKYLRSPGALRPAGYNPGDGSRMPDFHMTEDEVRGATDELMQQRTPLAGLKTNFNTGPLSAFARDKAIHLLQDKFSCLGCHRLGDKGGRLGPDLGGISSRLQPAYAFSIVADPRQVAPHSIMPRIPMPLESVELIVRCLLMGGWSNAPAQYLSPMDLLPVLSQFDERTRNSRANYLRHCAACHGVEGRGDGFNAAFLLPARPTVLADATYLSQRPDDTLFDGIHSGARILNRNPLMPAWGTIFTGSEIRELVRHLRALCQCEGPPWSRDGSSGRP